MHPIDELKRLVEARAKAKPAPWISNGYSDILSLPLSKEYNRLASEIDDKDIMPSDPRLDALPEHGVCQVEVEAGDTATEQGYKDMDFIAVAGSIDLAAILAAWERDRAVVEALIEARKAADEMDDAIETRMPDQCEMASENEMAAKLRLDAALDEYVASITQEATQ